MGLLLLNGESGLNPRTLFASGEQGLWLDPSDMNAGKAAWRRNLLGYTGELTNSYWSAVNSTVALDGSGPIASTPNAYVLTSTSTTGLLRKAWTLSTANEIRTISFYAKAGTSGWCAFRFNAFDTSPVAYFNLSTGQVGTVSVFLPTNSASIVSVGGGWYRCIVTNLQSSSDLSGNLDFHVTAGDNSLATVGGESIYLTGLQFETASTPTEYQPITDFSTEFKAAFPTHTLYQDSNGVTPCTAAGDPVGLILDQSRGGLSQIRADLVTNGGFAADTDWTKGANWTIGSGVATKTGGAANNLTQTIGSTAAAWYRISLDVTRSAGTLTVSLGTSGTTYAMTATGSYTFFILAGSGTQTLTLAGDSSFAGTVDNVVVRNVPGNHAYQTTSAARPTLQTSGGLWYLSFDGSDDSLVTNSVDFATWTQETRRNLLTNGEDFDNAYHVKNSVTVTANATTAPDGTSTADKMLEQAATADHYLSVPTGLLSATGTYTASVYFKASERTFGLVYIYDGATAKRAWFNLSTGQVGTVESGASAAISDAGNGWYRCSITRAITGNAAANAGFAVSPADNTTSYLGVVTSGIFIWGAQLETGSLTAYQRVGTDEMTVIAGVRKLSDAARGTVCELTATSASNNGAFHLTAPNAASATYAFESKGTLLTDGVASSVTAPLTSVISGSADISADTNVIRVNGSQSDSDTGDQGTGNYSNAAIYIGRRGSSSLPYNGHLYQLIIRGKTTPTGKLLEAERFTARKTGVTGI